ncbi:Uncharacterized protein TCM_034138 [Theobroma cacao]|uniref:Uncharacterized protein n=1 Tax=Theobroma cacao TaxID=3641 RepID=A0A061FK62_THECC|nr:Uncharacterized protein TCM_034138 [Theobroma cacao]
MGFPLLASTFMGVTKSPLPFSFSCTMVKEKVPAMGHHKPHQYQIKVQVKLIGSHAQSLAFIEKMANILKRLEYNEDFRF